MASLTILCLYYLFPIIFGEFPIIFTYLTLDLSFSFLEENVKNYYSFCVLEQTRGY